MINTLVKGVMTASLRSAPLMVCLEHSASSELNTPKPQNLG